MKAFELTPTEKRVLEMMQQGMRSGEIMAALGRDTKHANGHSDIIATTTEKQRLILLAQQDKTRPTAATTLAKARGAKRMKSDVRKGGWK